MSMKTILHAYCFRTREPEDLVAWLALKAKLKGMGLKCFESFPTGSGTHWLHKLDGVTLDLEDKFLFNNQWNTAPLEEGKNGYRVFDWALDYCPDNPHLKRGHWLEQTDEMKAAREDRMKCGYCGHQESRTTAPAFCPHCIDSEYLKAGDLYMTRMRPIMNDKSPPLTDEEAAILVPKWREAQIHGSTARGIACLKKARESCEADYRKAISRAETEYRGKMWLMDHGINTANAIFYNHTGRWCFGWRDNGLDAELVSTLLDVISEFPFPYDIKCADGRKLSGD